jgi:D-beta-D-heptose 7-phosphate kinase/D-beta-D-heptose 1-phosphate adenosyltransferase
MNIVLVTGGFDPIHSGHIAYFNAAKTLGNMLIVGVNSDEWLVRKKGKAFLDFNERCNIVNNIKSVDAVIGFDDGDGSAKDAIRKVRVQFPSAHIVFANGGDRTSKNIPEMDVGDNNISYIFGVGGSDKMNSSSWILNNWKQ